MQDLIRPDASFTPRELFARMQGAWFEPRQGSMWQENTGATPTTSGGQTIGKLVDLSGGHVASQAVAANRPTYQLDSNSLPLVRHNATDSLSVSLPAINVRRNLLHTVDFTNAFWKTGDPANPIIPNVAAPDGALSTKWVLNSTAVNRSFGSSGVAVSGGAANKTFTFSFDVYVPASNSANKFGTYIYATPEIPVPTLNLNALPRNQWVRVAFTWTFGATAGTDITAQFHGNFLETVGDTIYVRRPQLELGSVATDYQKITDWTSEAYSSSGSIYFATPQGMSALHNQSIGTSYNLPALQTDIYGTVITPARLVPPLEQRLALYMHRLAGLSDADFFWQEQATDGMTGQLLTDDNDTILLRA